MKTATQDTSTDRTCPTRLDGGVSLIAHTISERVCQDRRQGHYHKCATCAFHDPASLVPVPPRRPETSGATARSAPR